MSTDETKDLVHGLGETFLSHERAGHVERGGQKVRIGGLRGPIFLSRLLPAPLAIEDLAVGVELGGRRQRNVKGIG